MKKLAFIFLIASVSLETGFSQTLWQDISNRSTSTRAIRSIIRINNIEIAAATAGDGVLRSTDNGETWIFSNTGLITTDVNQLICTLSGQILATTSNGIFRSTNNGGTWSSASSWGRPFGRIVEERTRRYLFAEVGFDSVCRSTDEGTSWELDRRANTTLSDLAVDTTGNVISAEEITGRYGGSYFYISTNGGSTWNGPGRTPSWQNSLRVNRMGEFVLGKAPFYPSGEAGGIYKSTNNGTTWTRVYTSIPGYGSTNITIGNSRLLFGSEGNIVLRSTDDGSTWSQITSHPIVANVTAIDASGEAKFFVGTESGEIFSSTNDGLDWVRTFGGGIPDTIITAVDAGRNGLILAASNNVIGYGGHPYLCMSTNGGQTWTIILTAYNYFKDVHSARNGFCFALGGNGIRRSTDGGMTWTPSNIAGSPTSIFENTVGDLLMSGTYPPYRSTDNGTTWHNFPGWGPASLSIVQLRQGTIISSSDGSVQITTDTGRTWIRIWCCVGPISSFALDSQDRVFAGVISGDSMGVIRSTDHGVNWRSVLRDQQVNSLVTNSDGIVFAGTNGNGVLRSTDHGNTWSPFNDQVINLTVYSLAVDHSGFLYAGTRRGLYKTIDSTTTATKELQHKPEVFLLFQSYPNPFNPSTRIRFQIADYGLVTLKVFDVLGREVAALANEEMRSGRYERVFNAEGLASGVYLYRIQAGCRTETKKVLLLR